MSTVTEKKLLAASRKLPADKVREVVDFAEFLVAQSAERPGNGSPAGGRSLSRYMGGLKHGALSRDIDDTLYGPTVR